MKTDKAEALYIEKLNAYIEKYGPSLDTDTINLMIELELSDTVYEQHSNSCYKLNFIIILIQWLCVMASFIALIFNVRIGISFSIITTILLIVVLISNHIHDKTWKQAKERNKCIVELVKLLRENTKTETLKELVEITGQDFSNLDKE